MQSAHATVPVFESRGFHIEETFHFGVLQAATVFAFSCTPIASKLGSLKLGALCARLTPRSHTASCAHDTRTLLTALSLCAAAAGEE